MNPLPHKGSRSIQPIKIHELTDYPECKGRMNMLTHTENRFTFVRACKGYMWADKYKLRVFEQNSTSASNLT